MIELALGERLNPWRTGSIMRYVKLYLSQGLFEILIVLQPPRAPTPDTKQSQEANVPTRNSSLCWKFGEIRAQEPFLPPGGPRISSDISQWTDRYPIALGRSRALPIP